MIATALSQFRDPQVQDDESFIISVVNSEVTKMHRTQWEPTAIMVQSHVHRLWMMLKQHCKELRSKIVSILMKQQERL
jgi:hypothetical protein